MINPKLKTIHNGRQPLRIKENTDQFDLTQILTYALMYVLLNPELKCQRGNS